MYHIRLLNRPQQQPLALIANLVQVPIFLLPRVIKVGIMVTITGAFLRSSAITLYQAQEVSAQYTLGIMRRGQTVLYQVT
jgi:hypothetical protein